MDHGKLTDHNGKSVDFRNVILIMTTNAGAADMAKPAIGFENQVRVGDDEEAINRMFTPEFRNRLDATIAFARLSPDVISRVVDKFVMQLEAQLADRGVTITVTDEAGTWLAEKGFDLLYGARPLGRIIQENIKKQLADEMLLRQAEEGRRGPRLRRPEGGWHGKGIDPRRRAGDRADQAEAGNRSPRTPRKAGEAEEGEGNRCAGNAANQVRRKRPRRRRRRTRRRARRQRRRRCRARSRRPYEVRSAGRETARAFIVSCWHENSGRPRPTVDEPNPETALVRSSGHARICEPARRSS